jgi:hypothetical protein
MIPLKTTATTTTTTFPLRQQKTRQGDMSVVGMNALDHHIERLEAKLSFLIRSYDDSPTNSLYQYEKKIAIVKQEINEVMERRRCEIG